MSLEIEKALPSSLPLLDQHNSSGSYDFSEDEKDSQKARSSNALHVWSWAGQLLLFLISVVIALRRSSEPNCVEKLSTYSPVLGSISDDYQDIRFNSTVFGGSPYTGMPSPERDNRWYDLMSDGAFSISHDELMKVGAPESSVKLPPDSGGGYMAWLEVFHQLHCLHTLWQNTWPSYYNTTEKGSQEEDSIYRKHIGKVDDRQEHRYKLTGVDHCADNLRQKLMCDADAGVITYDWLTHHKHPVPNFNTVHKCRDLDAVWKWHAKHRAPASGTGELMKTPDSVVLDKLP
ncbi:Cyclochlorotine biosynthesis protein [Lachnellula subtilissima]|uniref:Cyclochlorotine biosynthesis protein n=1 Tax=Lachnellula subtilissima TaxID=602034 RepID=A0A8H8RFC5_9HELO|nr:Cyclochlorotine biosynthesis protein [Lachnellula subtilissima]